MSHSCEESYDSYVERHLTARKEHRCGACREVISPGHRYTRVYILFEREKETIKRCARCQKIHEHLRGKAPGEMWPDESLNCGEEYKAHWGEEPPEDIAALAFALPGEVEWPA